ncbi:MAG TPA: hypothetical protein VF979_09535 [Streptosporangiaceae bacterium]
MDVFSAPSAELPHDAGSPAQISRFVADIAQRTPSVYNTSPWWFSASDTDMCVNADAERKLNLADPVGRELTISCGAAVFTARVAMRNLGLVPRARVLPEPDSPNLIAKIGWAEERKPPSDYERKLFASITASRTHRGGFGSDRLPSGVMGELLQQVGREHVGLRVMADDERRTAVLTVVNAARSAFVLDDARIKEASAWAAPGGRGEGWGPLPLEQSAAPQSPGIVAILTTAADQRTDWVSAGQALQRLRLVAGLSGVAVAIDAEPLEFAHLRDFVSAELVKPTRAQLVLRFGGVGKGNST